ncbi:MAG TPA: methyltransferase [Gaiellaceae bacterium]|nr:methyltransferase [Gaiellaceae bacterium]
MSARSPETVLWDFLRGALMTRALGQVADLDVAEALADGPVAVADLADTVGADRDTLHRLLRALASDGVFAETEPGVFRNTETSELLRDPSQRAFAHLFAGVWHQAVGDLDAAAGKPTFPPRFGSDFWSWLAEHPAERAAFDSAMVGGFESRLERLASLDWRGDETIVDVGGGNGTLLLEFFRGQPGLRGIVFDLPETVRDERTFADRIDFVPGSFFERVPAAEVYVLATILHDWDDESAAAILRTIGASAPPGARLVILDGVVAPGNEPDGTKWLDLLMLALFGGRERTEPQWRALLDGAGLRPTRVDDGLIEARWR